MPMTVRDFEGLASQVLSRQNPEFHEGWDGHALTTLNLPIEIFDEWIIEEPLGGLDRELNDPNGSILEDTAGWAEGVDALLEQYPFQGVDVFAFYKSFRFKYQEPFPGSWGIFLIRQGVAAMGKLLQTELPTAPLPLLRQFGRDFLIQHEAYHFFVDIRALAMEFVTGDQFSSEVRYVPYRKMISTSPHEKDGDFEEALANHHALKNTKFPNYSPLGTTAARRALVKVLQQSPVPYCDFALNSEDRARMEGLLGSAMEWGTTCDGADRELTTRRLDPLLYGAAMTRYAPKGFPVPLSACPVNMVRMGSLSGIGTFFQGPPLREAEKFVKKYLNGVLDSHTDHRYFKIDNGEKLKIPNDHSSNLRSFEFDNLLAKAGMTTNDFFKERSRTNNWRKQCPRDPVIEPRG